jgi:hypothetical protein
MSRVSFRVDSRSMAYVKNVSANLARQKVQRRIADSLSDYAPTLTTLAKKNTPSRSGDTRRDIETRVRILKKGVAMSVGIWDKPTVTRAAANEFGTSQVNRWYGVKVTDLATRTIRPRSSRLLAMPTEYVSDSRGVPRYSSPRQYPGKLQFVRFGKQGQPVGKNRNVVGGLVDPTKPLVSGGFRSRHPGPRYPVLFLLLTHADLPAQGFLTKTMVVSLDEIERRVVVDLTRLFDA